MADAAVAALAPVVAAEFARRHGPPPGAGAVVLGMGSLGARQLNASSDLDLIVIYDAAGDETSTGRRPLGARAYYARLTQALVRDERLAVSVGGGTSQESMGGIASIAVDIAPGLVLRGADLTRLMVTLGVALVFGEIANQVQASLSAESADDRLKELVAKPLTDPDEHAEALALLRAHPALQQAREHTVAVAAQAKALLDEAGWALIP